MVFSDIVTDFKAKKPPLARGPDFVETILTGLVAVIQCVFGGVWCHFLVLVFFFFQGDIGLDLVFGKDVTRQQVIVVVAQGLHCFT